MNLSSSITFLKDAGQAAEAAEALKYYVESRHELPSFWDLKTHPFDSNVSDPDVRAAFEAKLTSVAVSRTRAKPCCVVPNTTAGIRRTLLLWRRFLLMSLQQCSRRSGGLLSKQLLISGLASGAWATRDQRWGGLEPTWSRRYA